MKPKKKSLFDSRRFTLVISLLLAFVAWVVVAGFIMPSDTRRLPNITIDYTRNEQDYRERNLQIVGERPDVYADVLVKGDSAQIGTLANTAVIVYPDYSQVTGPGVYELPLRTTRNSTATFTVTDVSVKGNGYALETNPKNTVSVTFEEVETKSFPVQVRADGIVPAEGFVRDTATTEPREVRITGPRSRVESIASVVVEWPEEATLSETLHQEDVELTLYDANGNLLDADTMGISFSTATVDLTIPILQLREIGLKAVFVGLPTYFDQAWFESRVVLSSDKLQVIGSTAAFESVSDPMPITEAAFDVSQLKLDWTSGPVEVQLPGGLRSQDQQKQVTVSFDTSGMMEKTFAVQVLDEEGALTDNLLVVNGFQNATIRPVSNNISIRLLGPEEQMNALLPENIIIQLDATGIPATATGQQTIPARILVPVANRCIPIGNYSVVCDVIMADADGEDA